MSKLTTLGKGVGSAVIDITKAGVNVVNKALDQTPKVKIIETYCKCQNVSITYPLGINYTIEFIRHG